MSGKNKVNIFDALNRLTAGDFEWFLSLDDEQVKGLPPYVLMLWVQGAQENTEYHTILTNLYVNSFVFGLGKHPRLSYLLLCVANNLGRTRFDWLVKKAKKPKAIDIIMRYYCYSEPEARQVVRFFDDEGIRQMGQELGLEAKEMKKLW